MLLIAANLLAFAFEVSRVGTSLLMGGGSIQSVIDAGALVPALVTSGEPWRLVTGAFLHGSLLHIAVNMYSLYVLGRFIEAMTGTARMTAIYAISLIGSSLAVTYLGEPVEVTVGASGAIFGLFGALFAVGFRLGRPGMRLVRANLTILVLNLIMTFAVPGISRWGHVGGLVIGCVATLLIYTPPRRAATLHPQPPG